MTMEGLFAAGGGRIGKVNCGECLAVDMQNCCNREKGFECTEVHGSLDAGLGTERITIDAPLCAGERGARKEGRGGFMTSLRSRMLDPAC